MRVSRIILHIDFNSYFATIEQQANPRLRGKPIGVTGGDRLSRTVLGTASVEAKKLGVKTGMSLPEARRVCPQILLVRGDSDKYLSTTKKFLNILKDYSPFLEVFSMDESFLEFNQLSYEEVFQIAVEIKQRIRKEIGEWVSCSVGISYSRVIAKLAGSLYKPDGLVVIEDEEAARGILDSVALDEICGIGFRVKRHLNNMGVFNFETLRKVPLENLLAAFKSYGRFLYDISRGVDYSLIVPFYEKEEVKSIGHRHTLDMDSSDEVEIKQILLKLTELIARRLRSKKLKGRTVHCWFRYKSNFWEGGGFWGDGMQVSITGTDDGLEIFQASWRIFKHLWSGEKIRMIGAVVSNLEPAEPENLSLLESENKRKDITRALDSINDRWGEFTLQRGVLLRSVKVRRKANSFMSDRRFKL